MARNSSLIKRLGKGVLGLAGLRLLDPIEVFYIPDEELFVPIISKSGCSTIKEAMIRKFNPSFESSFPEIHQVDPSEETRGKLLRLFFYQYGNYSRFARGKEMHLVLRNPAERFISCFKDVATGKNIMYRHPSEIYRWMPFKKGMSFEAFSRQVYKTPDYISDRHFRTQCFCLNQKVSEQLSELKIYSLSQFIKSSPLIPVDYSKSKRKLNKSAAVDINHPVPDELNSDPRFRRKYARDIHFYEEASQRTSY